MDSHSEQKLKHTPLYNWYTENKVKLMDFGGWAMPIQFSGILSEHHAVRNHAGLFDVSHMGELIVEGQGAEKWLNGLVTNDLTKVEIGQAQYNVVCTETGTALDDLIITKLDDEQFFITPNASNSETIFEWLEDHTDGTATVKNVSEKYGLLALQGPESEQILQQLTDFKVDELRSFYCAPIVNIKGLGPVMVSRTGYTGEDGFEIYCPASQTERLWELLLKTGKEKGLVPCGLGSRDTLRLEMGYPLYGQELSDKITPLEAGIGFAVKTKNKAEDYVGKQILSEQRKNGVAQKICGFEMDDKGIPRTGYPVYNEEGSEIGYVTSGTKSPTLGKVIGMAFVNAHYSKPDTSFLIGIRNKQLKAHVIKKPFYTKK